MFRMNACFCCVRFIFFSSSEEIGREERLRIMSHSAQNRSLGETEMTYSVPSGT